MPYRTDIVYRYDGTFDGFLCCVYESFAGRELPDAILGPGDGRLSLFETRDIITDRRIAARVYASIPARISPEAAECVERALLTCMPGKERRALAFLRLGYKVGARAMDMLQDDAVGPLRKAVASLEREAHLLTGFARFTANAGALVAVIEPKNRVLPLMARHFLDRYPRERFIIFDRAHGEALLGDRGRGRVVPLEGLEPPAPDATERAVRALWRRFFHAVSIGPRRNYVCQRTHLPLRFRRMMTEFATDVPARRDALPPGEG